MWSQKIHRYQNVVSERCRGVFSLGLAPGWKWLWLICLNSAYHKFDDHHFLSGNSPNSEKPIWCFLGTSWLSCECSAPKRNASLVSWSSTTWRLATTSLVWPSQKKGSVKHLQELDFHGPPKHIKTWWYWTPYQTIQFLGFIIYRLRLRTRAIQHHGAPAASSSQLQASQQSLSSSKGSSIACNRRGQLIQPEKKGLVVMHTWSGAIAELWLWDVPGKSP